MVASIRGTVAIEPHESGLELARIWMGRSEIQRAHALIGPIYNRFSEGFATPDLILAKEMLNRKTPT